MLNMRPLSLNGARLAMLTATLLITGPWQARAVTLTDGPKVVVDPGPKATISWTTDVASGTRLSYGTAADALTQRADGPVTASHTVTLQGLQNATTYYYSVGSARARLATGSFSTGGVPAQVPTLKPLPPVSEKPVVASNKKAPATPALKAPPTRSTWASLDSLPDHFERHGHDFNAASAEDYAAQAWAFLQRARQQSLPMKWDEADSTLRVWDPAKRIFAAYNRSGKTRTFFKPGSLDYWNKQPGRPIRSSELPF